MKGDKVATAYQDSKGQIFFCSSTDGGESWSDSLLLKSFTNQGSGNILQAMDVGGASNEQAIVSFSHSSDGTPTWTLFTPPSGIQSSGVGNISPNTVSFLSDELFIAQNVDIQSILELFYQQGFSSGFSPFAQGHGSPNNLRTRDTSSPSFMLHNATSNPDTVLAVTVPPYPKTSAPSPASVIFEKKTSPTRADGIWLPTGNQRTIPSSTIKQPLACFESVSNTSQIELVGLEDLSDATLIWRDGDLVFSSHFTLSTLIWDNPVKLNTDKKISKMGGVHLNPLNGHMQMLCRTTKGQLLQALGTMEEGFATSFVRATETPSVIQISESKIEGKFGWWLVLQYNSQGNKELVLLKGDAEQGTLPFGITIIESGLTSENDQNIAMAVGIDDSTNDVVAIFDIQASFPTFSQLFRGSLEGKSGPGTYVCRLPGGRPANATLKKLPAPKTDPG